MKKLILMTGALMALSTSAANASLIIAPVIEAAPAPVYYAPPPVAVVPLPYAYQYSRPVRHHAYDWGYWHGAPRPVGHPVVEHRR